MIERKVTLEEAKEAINTISKFCEQVSSTDCFHAACPVHDWCVKREEEIPADWERHEGRKGND